MHFIDNVSSFHLHDMGGKWLHLKSHASIMEFLCFYLLPEGWGSFLFF